MKTTNTSDKPPVNQNKEPRSESILRKVFVIVTVIILSLEIIFIVLKIPKQITAFHASTIIMVIALIITRPSIFKYGMKPVLGIIPVTYKMFLVITGYVLVIKIFFFSAYFGAMIADKW